MSKIHYFQRYSQKENVVTNNTLLLLSRLYNESPFKFKLFLNEMTDETDLDVGVNFSQQKKAKNSIPDGFIAQESFKIVIETKLGDDFSVKQLARHLEAFSNEQTKILLALGAELIGKEKREQLIKQITDFNSKKDSNISFLSLTFKEIVSIFRDTIEEYDFDLQAIIDDYEDFCISSKLIRKDEYRMLAVGCGYTLKDNFKNSVYYDPARRGYSYCSHLGIYHNKMIRGVGKIENVIKANLNDNDELEILTTTNGAPTDKQKTNIINTIKDTKKNIGWNIRKNHKFFCVDKFVETKFKKKSKGGLFGKKYFNLNRILNKKEFEDVEEIANLLKQKEW